MDGTVKVPGVGPVKKRWAAGGVAVLAVILGVAYYRHSRSANAAAAAPDGQSADGTTDPNAVDPDTGLTYAEEAAGISAGDLAGYGSAFGDTSGIIGYDAQGNPIYADQVGYGPAPSFTSNGAWAQAAEQYLVETTGANAGIVAAALGAYIDGQPLTSAQASVVQQAIAFFGQPPQAGSNGYPPSLKMAEPPGSGGGGGTAGSVAVPDVVGKDVEQATLMLQGAGLKAKGPAGAKGVEHIVTSQDPKAGATAKRGGTVRLTTKTVKENTLVPKGKPTGNPRDGGPARQ